ncbi:MAG: hypothetical protein JRH20_24485 [Deltaproteobacteria bacterium]|nr:hypothetical protein [Deltaproteobacteria bacterium]
MSTKAKSPLRQRIALARKIVKAAKEGKLTNKEGRRAHVAALFTPEALAEAAAASNAKTNPKLDAFFAKARRVLNSRSKAIKKTQATRKGSYSTMRDTLEIDDLSAFAEYKRIENDAKHGGFWLKVKRFWAGRTLRKEAKRIGQEAAADGSAGYDQLIIEDYKQKLAELKQQYGEANKLDQKGRLPRDVIHELNAQFKAQSGQMKFSTSLKILSHLNNNRKQYKGLAKALMGIGRWTSGLVFGSADRSKRSVEKALMAETATLTSQSMEAAQLARSMLLQAKRRGLDKRYAWKYKRSVKKAKATLDKTIKKSVTKGDILTLTTAHNLKLAYQFDTLRPKATPSEAQTTALNNDVTTAEKNLISRLTKQLAWRILHAKLAPMMTPPQLEPYVDNTALWNEIVATRASLLSRGEKLSAYAHHQVKWVKKYKNRGTFGQDFAKLIDHPLTGRSWKQMWLHIQRVPIGTAKLPFRFLGALARGGKPSMPPMAAESLAQLLQNQKQMRGELQQEQQEQQEQETGAQPNQGYQSAQDKVAGI